MSLIEELGGYEKAKENLNDFNESFGYWCDLNKELLEYRKAHSIFEDGDMVIDGLLGNQVIKYQDSYKFLGNGYVSHFVRHATPEEIKVGHRL